MQPPPGGNGNQNGNGFPPGAGWPPPTQPSWGQPQPQQPVNPAGSPFRPSPNDPYASYGQLNVQQPAGARPAGPGDAKLLKNPRLMGLMLLGIGVFLGGINYWSVTSNGHYYIKAMLLAPFALTYGLYLLAFGQPVDPATGKPRMWWRIGSGISLVAGLGLGGLAISYVGC